MRAEGREELRPELDRYLGPFQRRLVTAEARAHRDAFRRRHDELHQAKRVRRALHVGDEARLLAHDPPRNRLRERVLLARLATSGSNAADTPSPRRAPLALGVVLEMILRRATRKGVTELEEPA